MLYPETCATVLIAKNHTTYFMCKNMLMDCMDTHAKNALTKNRSNVSTHKKVWSVLTSVYLFVGNIFVTPTEAYAVAIADQIKCQSLKDPSIKWTRQLSKIYAWTIMSTMYPNWGKSEYKALVKLWTKESNWDHTSDNPNSSAYGIAQVLKTKKGTPAPAQIERGLSYIENRYGKPSIAWTHWRKHKWY